MPASFLDGQLRKRSSASAHEVHHQYDNEDDQEHIEQKLCDTGRGACDTAEAEEGGDESDDQSDKSIV
jgi:hypothetical protein